MAKQLKDDKTKIQKFWLHNDIFKSTFFDASSIFIPDGETYLVTVLDSVHSEIKNEKVKHILEHLREEEIAHSKVHTAYNRMIRDEGYEIDGYQKNLQKIFRFVQRWFSVKSKLAFCAAFEHITATGAILAVNKKVMNEGVDDRMREVWMWHFCEEIDHRSNMFDIYLHLGGGYFRRVIVMAYVAISFLYHAARIHMGLLYQSGNLFKWQVQKDGLIFCWGKNGFYFTAIWMIVKYFKPGFHPNEIHYEKDLEPEIHRYPIEDKLISYFP
jgi:predicted metal-dependent hydrolase